MKKIVTNYYNTNSLKTLCLKVLIENETKLNIIKSLQRINHNCYFDFKNSNNMYDIYNQDIYECFMVLAPHNFMSILNSFKAFLFKNKLLCAIPYSIKFNNLSNNSKKILFDCLTKKKMNLYPI
jgi:hypothetical protein